MERNNSNVAEDIRLIHNILATSISTTGFFANFITLIAIYRSRLYRDIYIIFIINLVIINCLSSGLATYIAYQSFTVMSTSQHNMKLCRFTGYLTYSFLGTEIMAIIQISFNRYFLILHLDKYRKIYTSREKVVVMLAASWLVYFILTMFPYTEIWGKLTYDSKRFICHPFLAHDSFTKFYSWFSIIIPGSSLMFCYVAIIWKVISTRRKVRRRVSTVENILLHVRQPPIKMPVTIIAILTAFSILYVPFFIVEVLDPSGEMFDPKVQVLAVYVAWFHLICHPIIYAVLNKQIKEALMKMFRCDRNKSVSPRPQNTITTIAG